MTDDKQMTEQERLEKFVMVLVDACKTHDDFLVFMRFGMKTLLENQGLLFRLIVIEAEREVGSMLENVPRIIAELDLHFEVTP